MQAADSVAYGYNSLITPRLNHVAGCVKNAQLAPDFLGKESNEMHCRTRFNVAKDQRLWQLPSA